MTIKKQLKRYVGRKAARRISNAMPWVGGAVALAALNSTSGRKVLGDLRRALEARSSNEPAALAGPDFNQTAVAK